MATSITKDPSTTNSPRMLSFSSSPRPIPIGDASRKASLDLKKLPPLHRNPKSAVIEKVNNTRKVKKENIPSPTSSSVHNLLKNARLRAEGTLDRLLTAMEHALAASASKETISQVLLEHTVLPLAEIRTLCSDILSLQEPTATKSGAPAPVNNGHGSAQTPSAERPASNTTPPPPAQTHRPQETDTAPPPAPASTMPPPPAGEQHTESASTRGSGHFPVPPPPPQPQLYGYYYPYPPQQPMHPHLSTAHTSMPYTPTAGPAPHSATAPRTNAQPAPATDPQPPSATNPQPAPTNSSPQNASAANAQPVAAKISMKDFHWHEYHSAGAHAIPWPGVTGLQAGDLYIHRVNGALTQAWYRNTNGWIDFSTQFNNFAHSPEVEHPTINKRVFVKRKVPKNQSDFAWLTREGIKRRNVRVDLEDADWMDR